MIGDWGGFTIRAARPDDAAQVAALMNAVIAEGGLTLFDRPFSVDDERRFLESLGPRSVLHVAEVDGTIAGVQSLDLYSNVAVSLAHVATMGTWLRADARGRGLGRALAQRSFVFAIAHDYSKIVITVLAGNTRARAFYESLGFDVIGIARAHVRLNSVLHDEVLMEKVLAG
ncbi:MAG TPA: GNAT family N-acetyltransferase [Vicinamibacterales bacterium]|nr:GNAT family N-acetyltransferase [Vicinamibacterales bacterium]